MLRKAQLCRLDGVSEGRKTQGTELTGIWHALQISGEMRRARRHLSSLLSSWTLETPSGLKTLGVQGQDPQSSLAWRTFESKTSCTQGTHARDLGTHQRLSSSSVAPSYELVYPLVFWIDMAECARDRLWEITDRLD